MDKIIELPFPSKGLDESQPLYRQPLGTTPSCLNVRPWNARNGRDQGAQRPGLEKLLDDRAQINGDYSIQELTQITVSGGATTVFGGGQIYAFKTGSWLILNTDGEQVTEVIGNENHMACFDNAGDYYVAFGDSSSAAYTEKLFVRKFRGSEPSRSLAQSQADIAATAASAATRGVARAAVYAKEGAAKAKADAVLAAELSGTSTYRGSGAVGSHGATYRGVAYRGPGAGASSAAATAAAAAAAAYAAAIAALDKADADAAGVVTVGKLEEQIWSIELDSTTGVMQRPLGIQVSDGIVYLYAAEGEGADNTALYRIDAANGNAFGTNPWISGASLLSYQGLGTVVNSVNTHMAIGKAVIGVATYNDTDDAARVQLITKATGVAVGTFNVKTGGAYGVTDIQGDADDNFYICFANNTTGVDATFTPVCNAIRKVNSAGATQWTFTGATGVFGVCYDRIFQRLLCVGEALTGAANVAILDASTGAISTSGSINSGNKCYGIRADGRGEYIVAGLTNQVMKVTAAFAETWRNSYTGVSRYFMAANSGWDVVSRTAGPGRVTRLIAISNGTVTGFDRKSVIPATSGSSAISGVPAVIMSAQNGPRLYFVDGTTTFKRYNPLTHAVETWSASSGSLPVNSADGPRLCESWRGRLVLSGIISDPQNWFMSAVNDPRNWEYGAATTVSTQAVAGNDPDVGLSPDVITCILPYSNTELWMGCDHSIIKFTGDPMAGGRIEVVSATIGMAWGRPWCRAPNGAIFFVSSLGSVYRLGNEGNMRPFSHQIDKRLAQLDVGRTIFRMSWDDRWNGFHLYCTPLDKRQYATHYWWDQGTDSWWPDQFTQRDHNPKCVYTFDGDEPEDRIVVVGSWDGYLRTFVDTARNDDGQAIRSNVTIGPLQLKQLAGFTLKDVQMTMDTESDRIDWRVRTGNSAQDALAANAQASGTFGAGRNHSQPARLFGQAAYIELSSSEKNRTWAMETLQLGMMPSGPNRQRIFT